MERVRDRQLAMMPIEFKLNGQTVIGRPDEKIIETAKKHGVEIPHLCHGGNQRSDGNCRACVVEIKGERVLAPSCCRFPTQGMEVTTNSPRALTSQKMVLELLLSDMPEQQYTLDNKLRNWAKRLGVGKPRFKTRAQPKNDLSHPAIAVNLDACIQCTRCVRACREVQVNDVIGYAGRGDHSKIVFDFDDPMGESTCVACGECVQACPTGALMPARGVGLRKADKTVDSVCPFCGVGCLLTYHVKDNKIIWVSGKDGPSNHNRLCVKGRYGFDYAHHPHRLTTPLIRKPGVKKSADLTVDPGNWSEVFREATWEEALDLAAAGLKKIRDQDRYALAGFGSAKGSNEEAYLFQKLVRAGFGTNNVDHCTRLCHASSVAALLEGIGSGAVTSDVALYNGWMHVLLRDGLYDRPFVEARTSGFDELRRVVAEYTPERCAQYTGIPAAEIERSARVFGQAKSAMIFWGMGISQHTHGTDNSRCLIALALLTGNVGRPGTGLHPLRGQNNVQGASDAGLIPMVFPDYQPVAKPEVRAKFEKAWGRALDPKPGL